MPLTVRVACSLAPLTLIAPRFAWPLTVRLVCSLAPLTLRLARVAAPLILSGPVTSSALASTARS